MFDEYIPVPELRCPKCSLVMTSWQGKDGPCALLVWRQGDVEAIDQPIDADARLPAERIRELRLPRKFVIYGGSCPCSSAYAAICTTDEAGRWTSCQLVTCDEARSFLDPDWRT